MRKSFVISIPDFILKSQLSLRLPLDNHKVKIRDTYGNLEPLNLKKCCVTRPIAKDRRKIL